MSESSGKILEILKTLWCVWDVCLMACRWWIWGACNNSGIMWNGLTLWTVSTAVKWAPQVIVGRCCVPDSSSAAAVVESSAWLERGALVSQPAGRARNKTEGDRSVQQAQAHRPSGDTSTSSWAAADDVMGQNPLQRAFEFIQASWHTGPTTNPAFTRKCMFHFSNNCNQTATFKGRSVFHMAVGQIWDRNAVFQPLFMVFQAWTACLWPCHRSKSGF